MAKQANMYYRGRVGKLIYYELNGSFYIRSLPEKVNQTAATKSRSSNLAVASKAGSILRGLLAPAISPFNDKHMQNMFAGAIMKWLKQNNVEQLQPTANLPYLQYFQFNNRCSLTEHCKIPITVTKVNDIQIEIGLPAFTPVKSITAPAHTISVECIVTAASCALKTRKANGSDTTQFTIPYTTDLVPSTLLSLTLPMNGGDLVLVTMALKYTIGDGYGKSNNLLFMPCGIVSAMYV